MTDLQHYLAEYFGGMDSRIYARATTGLYTLFESISKRFGKGEVIFPSICCESVAMAAHFAGLDPVIVDIDQENFCLDPVALQEKLSDRTRAVVLVYVFGMPCDPQPFLDLQERFDFILIEDLAQAVGGEWAGKRLGCTADYTMLSFADDKIIKGAGGALVRRTNRGPKLQPFVTDHVLSDSARSLRSGSLRNFSHSLYELARSNWEIDVSKNFWHQVKNYKDIYLAPDHWINIDRVMEQFELLLEEKRTRYQNHACYQSEILSDYVTVVDMPQSAMIWRTPLLAETPKVAFSITRLLRQNNIPVSNHYFPLDKLLTSQINENSELMGRCLLNLWVDASVGQQQVDSAIQLVNSYRC